MSWNLAMESDPGPDPAIGVLFLFGVLVLLATLAVSFVVGGLGLGVAVFVLSVCVQGFVAVVLAANFLLRPVERREVP